MRRAAIAALLALIGLVPAAAVGAGDPFETLALVRLTGGIKAPAFALLDVSSGRPVTVTSQGPAAILVFWTTW